MKFLKSSYFILLFLPVMIQAQAVEVTNVYFEPKGDELFIFLSLKQSKSPQYFYGLRTWCFLSQLLLILLGQESNFLDS